jgi:hypothetical protein
MVLVTQIAGQECYEPVDLYGQRRAGAGADQRDRHDHGGSPRRSPALMIASACAASLSSIEGATPGAWCGLWRR